MPDPIIPDYSGPIGSPRPGVPRPPQPVSPPDESRRRRPDRDGDGRRRKRRRKHAQNKKHRANRNDDDKLSPRELEREYGFAYKFFKSDPELWDLLQKAIKNNWSPQRFQANLQDTKWFRKHSDIWRQNTALKFSDPATYRERRANYQDMVQNLAGQWGADLTSRELKRYTERAFLFGWSEAQVLDAIAKEVVPGKDGHYGGELASVEQQLRQVALNNGVRIERGQLKKWMQKIVRGNADVTQYETYIRDVAAKTFEAYGREIRGGMDAVDVAAPYIQSMSDILELNPAQVNLFDKTIRRALAHKNDKGEAVPMSITDFEDSLRADRRWQYTDQAHEQMRGYAVELGKAWGLI